MAGQHSVAGTSPVTLKAQVCEAVATANTVTIIVKNQCGAAFRPISVNGFVTTIGAGNATLDIQVAGASILTTPIVIAAAFTIADGVVTSGTYIADNTDISFIFANASGGNITDSIGQLTGFVGHSS